MFSVTNLLAEVIPDDIGMLSTVLSLLLPLLLPIEERPRLRDA